MKVRLLAIASTILSIVVSASIAGSAQAYLVAGWDFSQYFNDGLLSIDGVAFQTTLSANYSDLDPTFGAGAESAPFGTLYFDGQHGSSAVAATGTYTEEILPTAGSLTSNLDVPAVSFDAFTVLLDEGQLFSNPMSMVARDSVSVVFKADLSTVPETGGNWSVSFGGKTFEGTSTVGIDFSTDGSSYAIVDSVILDANDAQFVVNLGTATSETAFVRLSFNPIGADQPIIDNVAVSVPEPGPVSQFFAVMISLLICGRACGSSAKSG
jgi:hypothetical protein